MDKGNSLSLPTGSSARQHLGSKKKSDSKNVHPGYSMFEWNVLCESGQDLTGVGGKLRKITLEELEKHSTEKDAWTAVRGKVYNMTHFMRFHPGGKAQLMRGAGNDCTELFDKIHVWVNSEHIMEKCLVGILDTPRSSQTHSLLSVMGGSAALTSTPSESGGDLSFTVPTLTTPTSTPSESGGDLSFTVPTLTTPQSTDKDTLPLHMLRQANIQTHDSVEEDIRIQVPSWIQPPSPLVPAVTTISEIGTSVDPPWLGYETAV